MGFQQGLSGLNISSKALDAVGNNIANAGTVGFKAAKAQFSDVYAATLVGGTGGNQAGLGASIAAVAQSFTQGNISASANPLDIAVNGNGFLRFQPSLTDATQNFTRNGQLHLDKNGYLANPQGQLLCAYLSADGETLDETQAVPLQVSSSQLAPRVTGFTNTVVSGEGGVGIGLNLDVRDKRADTAGNPVATNWTSLQTWDFDNLNPNMYNYSTSASVYDQRGDPHVLTMYFVRQGVDDGSGNYVGAGDWIPHFVLDNTYEFTTFTNDGAAPTGMMEFSASGQLDTTNNGSIFTLDLTQAYNRQNGLTEDLTGFPYEFFPDAVTEPTYSFTVNFANATQFGSAYDVNRLTQDGYGPGRLSGISIDGDGRISARYSNGETQLQGQIALSSFQNLNGLIPLGNNMFAQSESSGQPLEGKPNSGSRGSIQSGAVEDANVDLTEELVNMITLQRSYQANAQTIKTHDQILQTLVNLR